MADINALIAQGVAPIQIANPLAQMAQVAQIQHAQNQNALAQYQLGAAQRADVAAEARLKELRTAGADPAAIGQALLRAGDIKGYAEWEKALGERESRVLTQQKTQIDLQTARAAQFRDRLVQVPNRDAAIKWFDAQYRDPILGPLVSKVPFEQVVAEIPTDPEAFKSWKQEHALGISDYIKQNKPVVTQQTLGGTVRAIATPGLGGAAAVVPGSEAAVTMTEAQRLQDQRDRERIKLEGQRVGLEGRRLAVAEQDAAQRSDPEFQQRMAAAKATGEAIAKGDVAAQQALPKVIARAEQGLRLIDEMVGTQEVRDKNGKVIQPATKPHPGFENAVGTTWLPGARFVPGTAAADFMARFDQIKGASFLEAFESLKGGGAITEKEGTKATDAINRMSTSQSEKEFMSAARDLQEVIRKGVANAQRKAGGIGAAPQVGPAATGGVKFLGFE